MSYNSLNFSLKSFVRWLLVVFLLLFFFAGMLVAHAKQISTAQQNIPKTLTGAAARDFLTQTGLLAQLPQVASSIPQVVDNAPINDRFVQQQQLISSNGATSDQFGYSVALSGDTALVGAYNHTVGQGSAYVFVRTGSTWTQQAQLLASDGAANDEFGYSVALSGDTALVGTDNDTVGVNASQGSAYVFVRTGSTWTQQAQLLASDGAAGDQFGISVALSGDTALVGAYHHTVGNNAGQGSAYVFVRTGSTWTQQTQLLASDGAAGDEFGSSVALSGDTALVGAYHHTVGVNASQGSAYVFVRTGSTWTQQTQLLASDGAAGDHFGYSVALSGDTALVGAYHHTVGNNASQGSAYVFVRTGSTWTQQAQLIASDGAAGDQFGISVALSGDTALVGAYRHTVGNNAGQGSAYVFVRTGSTWTQQTQLLASDGAAGDHFGISVALSGDTALVGAYLDTVGVNASQGSAYLMQRSGLNWQMQSIAAGVANDQFGYTVALSGDIALVGAPYHKVALNSRQGIAYVFVRTGSTWTQQAQLLASDGAADDDFGISVALSGDTALVGAFRHTVGANAEQGSAYVFVRTGSTWTQQAQLLANDGAANDEFGISVALSGDTALVGADNHTVGVNASQGSAYVFVRTGSTWTQQAQLLANDGAATDEFGISVALSGDTALVGAFADTVGVNAGQGSAYVFVRTGSTWTQQTQLIAGDGATGDQFGYSVTLSGDTALIGAPYHKVALNGEQGVAYVFVRMGSTWTQQTQLLASDGAAHDRFGISVALSGDTALVGVYLDTVGVNASQGSAYVFVRTGSTWTQQTQLIASDGATGDQFGVSVALSDDTALVGAPLDDVNGNIDQGSAWLFVRQPGTSVGTKIKVADVVVSSALSDWPKSRLIDNDIKTVWSTTNHGEHLASAEWAALILADPTTVDHVRLYPRPNPSDPTIAIGFPKDFVLLYSFNGTDGSNRTFTCNPNDARFGRLENWKPLVSLFGYPQPKGDWLDFKFAATQVECVRILGTELSQDDYGYRYLQLGEFELYAGVQKIKVADVAVSSALSDWPKSRLIDNDIKTVWSTTNHGEHLASAEWAALILANPTTVDHVRLYPRPNPSDPTIAIGFPKDFVLLYSFNGTDGSNRTFTCNPNDARFGRLENWKPLVSLFGYPQPKGDWLDFKFAATQVECIRILGTELSQDDYGYRYLQLGEFELYAGVQKIKVADVAVSSALSDWPKSRLIDNDIKTVWSTTNHGEHLASAEWAALILANPTTVDHVRLYPRPNPSDPTIAIGFPKDFVLLYSFNGTDGSNRTFTCNPNDARFGRLENWKPLVSLFGYPQPKGDWLDFKFAATQVECIRILGTELSQDDYGYRYLQLGEFELYAK